MIIFKEIELFNIRQFDHKHFTFKTGFNRITMGPAQGKSTLIESFRSAFSIDEANPPGFLKDGTSESVIELEIEVNQKRYKISKKWKGQKLNGHTVTSEEEQQRFDLTNSTQATQWVLLYLKHVDKMFSDRIVSHQLNLLSQRYNLICELVLPCSGLLTAADNQWFHTVIDVHYYDHINRKLLEIQTIKADDLNTLKVDRQAASIDQQVIERFAGELAQTDMEIQQATSIITQLRKNGEADEAELNQADLIHEFILTKKNEIAKIDFELRSYNSILKNNISNEFSEEEIQEIEKKKKLYEQISSREELLQKKIIERGHLEKNMDGILHEITQRQIVQTISEKTNIRSPLTVYESEVVRIRKALKSYSNLDHDLEVTQKEKNLYRLSHEQYLVMAKLKQFSLQNEQKKIRPLVEKLEQDRDVIAKELETMQASIHEDRYRSLFSKVQQFRQQILEQRKRLETLYERRLKILRTYEEHVFDEPDLTIIESKIRKEIHLKKYISIMMEASQFIQNDLLVARTEEFMKYLRSQSAVLPDAFMQLAQEMLQENDKAVMQPIMRRYAHSQITEFNLLMRLLYLNYVAHRGVVILDEHYRWMMDPNQIARVEDFARRLNRSQVIAFDKN